MPEDAGRWRVFLSSTFTELKEYRRAVRERCEQNFGDRIELVALDDDEYSRVTLDASVLSAEKVRTCDLVVLLIGRELGSRAANGESYTEQEIRTAQHAGIPVISFMLDKGAEGLGRRGPAGPGPGDREWWDRERERQFRDGMGTRSTIVGQPAVSLRDPAGLAGETAKVLREWLNLHARPHALRATRPDLAFVDRDEPYRLLKERVLQGMTSVISGFYGAGKKTLTEALYADHDVARLYATPGIELSVDLSVPTSVAQFLKDAEKALVDIGGQPPGSRQLLVVTMSSVLDQGTQPGNGHPGGAPGAGQNGGEPDGSWPVEEFIRERLKGDGPLATRPTVIFRVPEVRAAGQIRRYLELGPQSHIQVPALAPRSALDLLTVRGRLHDQCPVCARYGPGAAAAAGGWPTLLVSCALSFDEQATRDEQHEYLQRAGQAFSQQLSRRDQMYRTFQRQVSLLPETAQDVLDAAGVLLPRPFTLPEDLIQATCGLPAEQTPAALDALAARGYMERAANDEDGGRVFTTHPFFWIFLRQRHEQQAAEAAAAARTPEFRADALGWLGEQMNETFDNDLSYSGWFELEKPESQSLIANWVYQLAHADDRLRAAEELTRIFLKAHWWWGYYVPFGFCDLLIELGDKAVGWSPHAVSDELRAVTGELRVINDTYPRMAQFDDPPAPAAARTAWAQTQKALRSIAGELGVPVDGDLAAVRRWAGDEAEDEDRVQTRLDIAKLLHAFLADCEQCFHGETSLTDQAIRRIERHFDLALAITRAQDDSWNQPWFYSELADALLAAAPAVRRGQKDAPKRTEAGCLKKARSCADRALRLARKRGEADEDELDFEVISICERLLGDCDLMAGSPDAAAGHYARAVHYAHCFEVCPDHQPDHYTWMFEREQWWRVTSVALDLADAGDDDGLRTLTGGITAFLGTDPRAALRQVTRAASAGRRRGEKSAVLLSGLFAPYYLPLPEDLDRRDEPARRNIELFRMQAKAMIRSAEQRHPDLVRLPE
jgi:hypothetical protein